MIQLVIDGPPNDLARRPALAAVYAFEDAQRRRSVEHVEEPTPDALEPTALVGLVFGGMTTNALRIFLEARPIPPLCVGDVAQHLLDAAIAARAVPRMRGQGQQRRTAGTDHRAGKRYVGGRRGDLVDAPDRVDLVAVDPEALEPLDAVVANLRRADAERTGETEIAIDGIWDLCQRGVRVHADADAPDVVEKPGFGPSSRVRRGHTETDARHDAGAVRIGSVGTRPER